MAEVVKIEPIINVPEILWLAVKGVWQMVTSLPWYLLLLVVVMVVIKLRWPTAFAGGPSGAPRRRRRRRYRD